MCQHQRTCPTRNNTRTGSKDAQEILNVEVSSKNSVTIEDDLTMLCAKYIWGKYNDYDFEKHFRLRKNSVSEEKPLFAAVWKSRKKIHRGSFQIDERMAARFATERYCV